MSARLGSLLVAAGLALAGCCAHRDAAAAPPAPGEPAHVPVEALRGSDQCGAEAPGAWVRWLPDEASWRQALPAARLGAAAPAFEVDFATSGVLLVGLGQRPTAGHAVELAAPVARRAGRAAVVRVALRSPAPGALAAQVLTSPCLAVRLPRAGLDEVRVEAEDGRLLGVAPIR